MDKIKKMAEIILDYMDEYNSNEPNRPMIPRLCAEKVLKTINSLPEEPVSEELEEEIKRMIYDSYYDVAGIAIKGSSLYLKVDGLATIARHFAQWQKRKTIDKACEWLEKHCIEYWGTEAIDNGKMIDDFRKALEED